MNKRIAAKDIRDEAMLDVVWRVQQIKRRWALRSEIAEYFPSVPERVLLAKLRRLVLRGKLDGCFCGCRGDFEIPLDKC